MNELLNPIYSPFIVIALIVIVLLFLNITDVFLSISRAITKDYILFKRRIQHNKIKLDLEKAIQAAAIKAKQAIIQNQNPGNLIISGGGLVPNPNQQYNLGSQGARITFQSPQNAFVPAFSILDQTQFTQDDAKILRELLKTKVEALENAIADESDYEQKKELQLTLLTLKYLSSECERMLL